MEIIKKTLVVLVLCSFIMGTVPISVLAQQNSPGNQIFEHVGPDLSDDEQYADDEIIVKFKAGTSDDTISVLNSKNKVVSSEKILKKNPKAVENDKTNILKKHGLDMIYLLKLPDNSDVNKMVSKYNENPDVDYAEPNYKVYVDATIPDDSYFSLLWGMHNTGQSDGTVDADIDALEAWGITTGSSDIVVAVIDTGVDYTHQDLTANMWTNINESLDGNDNDGNGYVDDIWGWDFFDDDNNPDDGSGHGTHCSGTIAAVGNNGIGVVGVSWNAKIMPLRFLGPDGGYTDDAILAIIYATDNGADIMSNSWGGGWYSVALENAISAANDAGVLFVAAAGNSRTNTDRRPHYPSSYDVANIISVAATDRYDNLASFSNYGLNSVDLGAPGVYIASTYPGDSYYYMSGTSMAAPHVAGAAALIMAQNPGMSVDVLKAKILGSVDTISDLDGKTVTGGRLNVFNCLETNAELDIEPPKITHITGDTSTTTGDPTNIVVTATDNIDSTSAKIFIDENTVGIELTEGLDDTFTHTYTAPADSVASHAYYVTVYDDADNSATSETYTITVTDDDAPTADAGPNQTVLVDDVVEFDGFASTDNIGIIGYSWDYDVSDVIQADATDITTSHIYDTTGTYTVTLTVTDIAGNTDSDTLTVNVIEEAGTMHVASIDVSTTEIKLNGWYTYATATVTIVNASGTPVEGATVSGTWSGLTSDSDSGNTGTDGKISLDSELVKNAAGTFTFTVDNVILTGLTYDPDANEEASDSITV